MIKRILLITVLMAGNAHAFDFGFGFNFGQKSSVSWVDLQSGMSLTPSSHDYGSHDTGTNTDYTFTLSNPGNDLLEAVTLTVAGTGFSKLSTTCGTEPFDLASLATCTVTVRFTPGSAGAKSGTLTASAPNLSNVVVTLAGSGAADVIAPTLSSATVATNGTTLTLAFSENVTQGAGYNNTNWGVDCPSATNIPVTYVSGNDTNSHVYSLGGTVLASDSTSCNIDFNGASNSMEDAAGNDLAAITSAAVTNNSTATAYITYKSNNFACGDNATVNTCGAPDTFNTETDGGSIGSIVSGQYVIAMVAQTTSSYVTWSGLTPHGDIQLQFDVKPSAVTGLGNNGFTTVGSFRASSTTIIAVDLKNNGTNLSQVRVAYTNGSNTYTTASTTTYAFVAGTTYTFKLQGKASSDTSTNNGEYRLLINDAEVIPLTNYITMDRTGTIASVGNFSSNVATTQTLTFDNVILGYK